MADGKDVGETGCACGETAGVNAGESVLLVQPSSCSITPPAGEGDSLQLVVGGAVSAKPRP